MRLGVEWLRRGAVNPLGVGGRTLAAQIAFQDLSRTLIRVANTELRLRRIGEEIKKTACRVNALEQVVIPGIRSQIRFIQQVLDQQEQEDIFRLKRVKGKIVLRGSGQDFNPGAVQKPFKQTRASSGFNLQMFSVSNKCSSYLSPSSDAFIVK